MRGWHCVQLLFAVLLTFASSGSAFTTTTTTTSNNNLPLYGTTDDDDDIIAKRLIVTGDVQGGYYRSCVINEAGRFRKLTGTMSPPDIDSDQAEIYVEGKKNMVEGFVRWCQRSKVGLNQKIELTDVKDEEPTGIFEEFYAKTKAD